MRPDRYAQVWELFFAALERPEDERSALLEARCGDDRKLREEVEALLAHDAAPESFIQQPAVARDPQSIATVEQETVDRPPTPDRIGRYEIRRVLGAGGMGTVYEAVQDHPHRIVALKVMRRGVASRSAMKRFQHEAEILGRLKHPNIAQVYDAGTFDEGEGAQPYFALEYISGDPLIAYAEARELGTRDRLDLFGKICDAVQYAHRKGVIHRDLKPDNILVDENREPKILDFGVARATDSDIQTTTLRTDIGQLIGTVPYMSPEQVAGDPNRLDTRSDVYSLGVVLYELLCGRLPHDLRNKTIPEAVRVIREEEPTPLSSVSRVFRGDLDTIVTKALEKETDRRYQTAAALAADVRHYLTDEPIVARPASTFYQLRKFTRRNKALVGGVVGMMALFFVGTALVTWQTVRARAEYVRSVTIEEILTGILGSADAWTVGRMLTVEDVLDRAVGEINVRLAGQPLVEAKVRHSIGLSYAAHSVDKSAEQLRLAFEIRSRELGREHPETLDTADDLARTLIHTKNAEVEELLRWLIDARRRTQGEDHKDTLWSTAQLAIALQSFGTKLDEAESIARRAIKGLTRAHGEGHERTLRVRIALTRVLLALRKLDEAERESRDTLKLAHDVLGAEHYLVVEAMVNLGTTYHHMDRWDEAEPLLRSAIENERRLFVDDDFVAFAWTANLGTMLYQRGDREEGERLVRQSVAGLRRVLGPDHLLTATHEGGLADIEWDHGDLDEAERLLRHRIEVEQSVRGEAGALFTMNRLASRLAEKKDFDGAESLWRERLDIQRREFGNDDKRTLQSMNQLAWFLKDRGPEELAEAEDLAREATSLARSALGENDRLTFQIADTLAVILQMRGKNEEAVSVFEDVVFAARQAVGDERWHTAMTTTHFVEALAELTGRMDLKVEDPEDVERVLEALIALYEAWGKPAKAAEYRALLPEAEYVRDSD
ncbi:MAG: protein kinase domain-containing protein [Planctomycetota bacterium]|jgi:tetratricopeptide (TPR) repeat protein